MREIPKIINYCWFGRGKKNKVMLKCMETWEKHFSDYQLVEWNEDNFRLENAPVYVQEAYQEKKYAFVSDYVRLYALKTNGGIYMDTDIEVVRNFDSLLENRQFVVGFELPNSVMTGFIATVQSHPIINKFLDFYEDLKFINPDGTYNLQANPIQFTRIVVDYGLVPNGTHQLINEKIEVFPIEYFCGFDLNNDHEIITENTYTIHHYTGTWNDATLKRKFFKRKLVTFLGPEKYDKVKRYYKNIFK